MAKAEDTDVFHLHEIPDFVYWTELETFNDWDTRAFPEMAPRPEALRIRSTAVFKDAEKLVKYMDEFLDASGFREVMGPVDVAQWLTITNLLDHITRNREEVEVDGRTIVKHPLESQDYLKTWWELSAKASARTYRNLMEMEFLYRQLHPRVRGLLTSVENWVGDMDDSEGEVVQKKLDDFRIKTYEKVRKQLVDKRYRDRAVSREGKDV